MTDDYDDDAVACREAIADELAAIAVACNKLSANLADTLGSVAETLRDMKMCVEALAAGQVLTRNMLEGKLNRIGGELDAIKGAVVGAYEVSFEDAEETMPRVYPIALVDPGRGRIVAPTRGPSGIAPPMGR